MSQINFLASIQAALNTLLIFLHSQADPLVYAHSQWITPPAKCHSTKLSAILPESIALFGLVA